MKKLLLIIFGVFIFLIAASAIVTIMMKDGIALGDKIALVTITGPIIDSRDTVDEIKEHVEDSSVKAIVIRVDSPGGAVAPSQEIYEQVKKAVQKKKVVVSMGSLAASGGYYISVPANRIIANPGTITGSIGVIMEIPSVEGLMKKVGISTRVIKSGRNKDMASVFREMSDEERDILQGVIDDVFEQFVNDVSEARNMPLATVKKLADGRIYSGKQALELGLVDELGSLQDAISVCAKLAGIKGEPEVITKKKDSSIWELLKGKLSGSLSEVFPSVSLKYMFMP